MRSSTISHLCQLVSERRGDVGGQGSLHSNQFVYACKYVSCFLFSE